MNKILYTYNGHDEVLVRRINEAWNDDEKRYMFAFIVYAIAWRDYTECEEKIGCDMGNFLSRIIDNCDPDAIHMVLELVCDDHDLETILSFVTLLFF